MAGFEAGAQRSGVSPREGRGRHHGRILTNEIPLPGLLIGRRVYLVHHGRQVDLGTVIGPRPEFHMAELVIKREPFYINGTRANVKTYVDGKEKEHRRQQLVK